MRKLALLVLILAIATFCSATIFRVNNIPTAGAPYTSIGEALDDVVDGDTIIVEPSPNHYGSFTLTDQVTMLGGGYYQDNSVHYNEYVSKIDGCSFNTGSSGSILAGFDVTGDGIGVNVSDVHLQNLRNTYISVSVNDSIEISSCVDVAIYPSNSSAVYVHNCLIDGFSCPSTANLYLFNNVITCTGLTCQNVYAYNNIFTSSLFDVNGALDFNNVFQYNLGSSPYLNPVLHNIIIEDDDWDEVFVQEHTGYEDAYMHYRLTPGSPAIGAGMDGYDMGMFGGPAPYKPGGVPWQLPTIFSYDVTETENMINIQIGAKNHPSPGSGARTDNGQSETESQRDN